MGMFIFVHLTPASCNWLCYGCHSNALSVALAAVILHSSAWLSSKTNKRENESVCCLHLLILREDWPCHSGQAPVPSPNPQPSTQNALQIPLATPLSLSQEPCFHQVTYEMVWVGVAYVYSQSGCRVSLSMRFPLLFHAVPSGQEHLSFISKTKTFINHSFFVFCLLVTDWQMFCQFFIY